MKLAINLESLPVPVSKALVKHLDQLANESGNFNEQTTAITFNFRDTSYSADAGGYHPVEIRIQRNGDAWLFDYITDFSYQGYSYAEIAKEFDVDFNDGHAYVLHLGEVPFEQITEFYCLWEANFIAYLEMGCFDEIRLTIED